MRPLLASETGARPGAILVGASFANAEMRVVVLTKQSAGSGRRIEGSFRLINCGEGPYADYLRSFQQMEFGSARELIDKVRSLGGGEKCTHILNLNMLVVDRT